VDKVRIGLLGLLITAITGGGLLLLGRADDGPVQGEPTTTTATSTAPGRPLPEGPAPGAPESLRGATDEDRPSGRTPAGEAFDELAWACRERRVRATGLVDDSSLDVVTGPGEVVADVDAPGVRQVAFQSDLEVLFVWVDDDEAIVRADLVAAIGGTWTTAETGECAGG
jgi:hypothetical protein